MDLTSVLKEELTLNFRDRPSDEISSLAVKCFEDFLVREWRYQVSDVTDLSELEEPMRFVMDPVKGSYEELLIYGGLLQLYVSSEKERKTTALVMACDYSLEGNEKTGTSTILLTNDGQFSAHYAQEGLSIGMVHAWLFKDQIHVPYRKKQRDMASFLAPLKPATPKGAYLQLRELGQLAIDVYDRWISIRNLPG